MGWISAGFLGSKSQRRVHEGARHAQNSRPPCQRHTEELEPQRRSMKVKVWQLVQRRQRVPDRLPAAPEHNQTLADAT